MNLIRKTKSKTLKITPKCGNSLYDITSMINLVLEKNKLKNGLLNIHVQSSTAAITIQENGESHLKKDIVLLLNGLVSSYLKTKEILEINNDARIKAALIGSNKTIPIIKGKLALADCQKIFLCEFDQPNIQRKIIITPI